MKAIGGRLLRDPRSLHGEQELIGAMLSDVRADLARGRDCVRHQLARAFVLGRYECGCEYIAAGISFAEAAAVLHTDPEDLAAKFHIEHSQGDDEWTVRCMDHRIAEKDAELRALLRELRRLARLAGRRAARPRRVAAASGQLLLFVAA